MVRLSVLEGGRDCKRTCMGEQEPPAWDLSLELEGLSLRLRGLRVSGSQGRASSPASSLSGFTLVPSERPVSPNALTRVQQPASSAGPADLTPKARTPVCSRAGGSPPPQPAPLQPCTSPPSTTVVPEYPLHSRASPLGFQARQVLALSFPETPDSCIGLCRGLSTANLDPRQRADRAWRAGCWARAVLDLRVDRPDPSEPLDLASRFYCVLRADGLDSPIVCSSLATFRRVVGPHLRTSVSHGFPSSSEARVYFAGASLPYPPALTR